MLLGTYIDRYKLFLILYQYYVYIRTLVQGKILYPNSGTSNHNLIVCASMASQSAAVKTS